MDKNQARLSAPNRDQLLTILFEILGVEFVENGGAWEAALFGGTSFVLTPVEKQLNEYNLVVVTDRTDPLFRKQQKVFGQIEDLPAFLTECCAARGVQCVWQT